MSRGEPERRRGIHDRLFRTILLPGSLNDHQRYQHWSFYRNVPPVWNKCNSYSSRYSSPTFLWGRQNNETVLHALMQSPTISHLWSYIEQLCRVWNETVNWLYGQYSLAAFLQKGWNGRFYNSNSYAERMCMPDTFETWINTFLPAKSLYRLKMKIWAEREVMLSKYFEKNRKIWPKWAGVNVGATLSFFLYNQESASLTAFLNTVNCTCPRFTAVVL